MRRARGILAAAVAALLTGCASPALPAGVDVSLVQLRSDVASGDAQVRIANATDEPLEIGAVEVVDARFAEPAVRTDPDRSTTVRPGATVDIRVHLPEAACPGGDGGPTARLEIDGAIVETLVVDALSVLAPLHERACRAERLAEAVDVSFGSFDDGMLELRVQPTGDGDASVIAIRPTNLLRFADVDDAHPVTEGSTALPLEPTRCDPHAVQEDKRGAVFTLDVEIDGEPGTVELAAPDDLRGRLLAWVPEWCAARPATPQE